MGLPSWQRRYARKLAATDCGIIVASLATAQALRFEMSVDEMHIAERGIPEFGITYTALSIMLGLAWLYCLSLFDTRDQRVIGFGPEEYRRTFQATIVPFALFAIIAFAVSFPFGRGYLFISLPMGVILMFTTRYLWRKRLHLKRKRLQNSYRTLLVGNHAKSRHVANQLLARRYLGFQIIGSITEGGSERGATHKIPVLGGYDRIIDVADSHRVEILVLTDTDALSPQRIRELGWELESRGISLVVATALTDVAGPRLHSRPVGGLPLTFVDYPEFTRFKRLMKRAFDVVCTSAILLVLSPLLLIVALVVRFGSEGPVIFRQTRVGIHGTPFVMYKFRSMVPDAEAWMSDLLNQDTPSDATTPNAVLFKLKNDPRVTREGRIMRKFSLDELPQLLNVLKGDMSLVGPRPPLTREVEQYGLWDHRRLLVRPGITGLWQTSGRSNLSWEESIRLDLYYVENWSFIGDLILLAKTLKIVVKPEGAY